MERESEEEGTRMQTNHHHVFGLYCYIQNFFYCSNMAPLDWLQKIKKNINPTTNERYVTHDNNNKYGFQNCL